jgi:hypothetical protein
MSDHAGQQQAAAPPMSEAQPVQSPLTLIMPIASAAAFQELSQTLTGVQSLPRDQNPIMAALDKIGTVHFARFVFLEDNTRLGVITTYDGDFEKYINDFVDDIGDVFNLLLKFMADAPPLPVQEHRQEFLEYVRAHDLRSVGPFYSAYPRSTVLDIQAATAAAGQ